MNLFNAPNALSGLCTGHSLLSPGLMRLVAESAAEAIKVLDAAGLGATDRLPSKDTLPNMWRL